MSVTITCTRCHKRLEFNTTAEYLSNMNPPVAWPSAKKFYHIYGDDGEPLGDACPSCFAEYEKLRETWRKQVERNLREWWTAGGRQPTSSEGRFAK